MKERPILFSAPMVRAILSGRKCQTRRVVKGNALKWLDHFGFTPGFVANPENHQCPYGQPGDRLWVRENGWERPYRTANMMREGADTWEPYYFDADGYGNADAEQFKELGFKRRPSIHMPRWASRITLEITGVRVERLQDISEADATAEGVVVPGFPGAESAIGAFHELWASIHGPYAWELNPWVWVIEFRRVPS